MSRGFDTNSIPEITREGICKAFGEWRAMSNEWLRSAPEYFLTVRIAQELVTSIPLNKRTVYMERPVSQALVAADARQRGVKAAAMRHGGRFDIVLASARAKPRTIIEVKNGVITRAGKSITDDLKRICQCLTYGEQKSNLYSGVLAFYTDIAPTNRAELAGDKLKRRYGKEFTEELMTWDWAPKDTRKKFKDNLLIECKCKVETEEINGGENAWAAVSIEIRKRSARN